MLERVNRVEERRTVTWRKEELSWGCGKDLESGSAAWASGRAVERLDSATTQKTKVRRRILVVRREFWFLERRDVVKNGVPKIVVDVYARRNGYGKVGSFILILKSIGSLCDQKEIHGPRKNFTYILSCVEWCWDIQYLGTMSPLLD